MDKERASHLPDTINFIAGDVTQPEALAYALTGKDAVIACLPYHLILPVADAAHKAGLHYFDPTEDVATTEAIRKLAHTAKDVMIPQNGLAPGFIAILGAHLARQFDAGTLRHIKMRSDSSAMRATGHWKAWYMSTSPRVMSSCTANARRCKP
jgi:saccharopine dehydrogenase-like NADP-dependent oxidoreductase